MTENVLCEHSSNAGTVIEYVDHQTSSCKHVYSEASEDFNQNIYLAATKVISKFDEVYFDRCKFVIR